MHFCCLQVKTMPLCQCAIRKQKHMSFSALAYCQHSYWLISIIWHTVWEHFTCAAVEKKKNTQQTQITLLYIHFKSAGLEGKGQSGIFFTLQSVWVEIINCMFFFCFSVGWDKSTCYKCSFPYSRNFLEMSVNTLKQDKIKAYLHLQNHVASHCLRWSNKILVLKFRQLNVKAWSLSWSGYWHRLSLFSKAVYQLSIWRVSQWDLGPHLGLKTKNVTSFLSWPSTFVCLKADHITVYTHFTHLGNMWPEPTPTCWVVLRKQDVSTQL